MVKIYQRTQDPAPGKYPLRCGSVARRYGYLHMLDRVQHGDTTHGDPINDSVFEAEMAHALDRGKPNVQGNMIALDVEYNPVDSACHGNAWGFRVVISTNPPPTPLGTKPDRLPFGINTAYRLTKKPGT